MNARIAGAVRMLYLRPFQAVTNSAETYFR
jgi:hypothetical protein